MALSTLSLGTLSTVGSANAASIETDDMPQASGVAVEQERSEAAADYECSGVTSNKAEHGLPEKLEDGAILHAWCWSCNTITANMKDIAAAGYTAIQTSPMQQSYSRYSNKNTLMGKDNNGKDITDGSGGAWWWQYQPTAQKLGNYQFFSQPNNYEKCCEEYATMCSTAEDYGISIITDIVSNHTTSHYVLKDGVENTNGQIDISSDMTAAVGGYNNLWHENAFIPSDTKDSNYSNFDTRARMINFMNGGLPDINTENAAYQAYVVKYMNKLIELGCDGFRFDTAHRIGISTVENDTTYNYWDAVTGVNTVKDYWNKDVQLGKLTNSTVSPDDLFIYGEMLKSDYNSGYTQKIRITDFNYGQQVRSAVHNNSISTSSVMQNSSKMYTINGESCNNVTWVESHDDYCNTHDSKNLTESDIHLSWAILTARKAGTPLFFSRPDGSDAISGNYWGNNVAGAIGNDDFKDPEIAAVNHFRNAMVGESEYLRNIGTNNKAIQIDRGDRGSCIVNLNNSELQLTGLATNMADGNYVDTVTGAIINVSNGQFTGGSVSKESIACIYCPIKFGVDSDTYYFSDDSCTVTTTLDKSIASGTYTVTIDGEILESGSFTDNSEITIGKGVDVGSTSKEIVLTLKVVYPRNNNVVLTEKYSYVKYSSKDITYVYYDPAAHTSWGDNIYVYIYKDDGKGGVIENAAWPGVLLSDDTESGLKKYEVPYELKYGNVIFNNNNDKQYPGKDSSDTLPLEGISKAHTSGKWEAYLEPDYSYVYFFNSMGWKDDINAYLWDGGTNNNWPGEKMDFSEELHCYYLKYDSSKGYTKISFNADNSDSDKIRSEDLTLSPGKIYVPTGSSKDGAKTTYTGSWKNCSDIKSNKIYFKKPSDSWGDVKAYMTYGNMCNSTSSGDSMTECDEDNYCYTYYYLNGHEYNNVTFLDGTNSTGALEISNELSKPLIYDSTLKTAELSEAKTIPVNMNFYDRKVGTSGTQSSYSESVCTLTKDISTNGPDLEQVVADAVGELEVKNVYDNYVFSASQDEYVRSNASTVDSYRVGDNLPYSAKVDPKYFTYYTKAFSSTYSDYYDELQKSYNDKKKWVTYKDKDNNEVLPDEVEPDLENVSYIEVWGFNSPEIYHVSFVYPKTASDFTDMKSFKFNQDKFYVKQYSGTAEEACFYNQLVNETDDLTSDMYSNNNYTFDGWYAVNFYTSGVNNGKVQSYMKVSSNKKFSYRTTSDMVLYAVFRPSAEGLSEPGASSVASASDVYLNDSGSIIYRFNTILNVYNCVDNDDKISDVGIVYVRFNNGENYNVESVKNKLTEIIGDNTSSSGTLAVTSNQSPQYRYDKYTVSSIGSLNTVKLTAKNRLQFVINVPQRAAETGSYSNMLAFTVFKRDGTWYVSDNCVAFQGGTAQQIYKQN